MLTSNSRTKLSCLVPGGRSQVEIAGTWIDHPHRVATGRKWRLSFKASNLLRFAAALLAISIYANAFPADAQVAPDIASTSPSASATSTLTLRVPVLPGGTPPLASNAPAVGRFEQEVTSLENRRIQFSQSADYLLREFVHSSLENAEPGFCRLPGRQLRVRRFAPERLRSVCVPPGLTA